MLLGSEHAQGVAAGGGMNLLTADWCTSPPRFMGKDQLWVSCQDNGFLALRFTNNAYAPPSAVAHPAAGPVQAPTGVTSAPGGALAATGLGLPLVWLALGLLGAALLPRLRSAA